MSDDPTPPPTQASELDVYWAKDPDENWTQEEFESWAFLTWSAMDRRLKDYICAEVRGETKVRSTTRIPKLTPATKPAYIAAVARAVSRGHLQPNAGRALLYAAQLLK